MHSRSSKSTWGHQDPLSAVLVDLRLSGTFFCNSDLGMPWAMQVPVRDFASFHFVATGSARVTLGKTVIDLGRGDLVLLPRSPAHVLSDGKTRKTVRIDRLDERPIALSVSTVRHGGDGERSLLVCGGVRFDGFPGSELARLLPEVVVLRARDSDVTLRAVIDAMQAESIEARPGSATVMTRLADVLIVHAVRTHLTSETSQGWLAALRDPQLGSALSELHRRPEHAWTVESLAARARMSRSGFSQRFTALVGVAPMHYLTRVRMNRARELLLRESLTIAELAERLGYRSEPAFSRAFKRTLGVAPAHVRRELRVRSVTGAGP